MGGLHLKETPEERAERKWKKRKKDGRKSHQSHSHKKDTKEANNQRGQAGSDDLYHDGFDDEGWAPQEGSTKIDMDQVRAEVEERMFREKLFDAMGEDYDHRLDGMEARMNTYAHVPNRWKNSHIDERDRVDGPAGDPHQMSDEEYAEWIRMGMFRWGGVILGYALAAIDNWLTSFVGRRTHKAEIEERQRKKAERKARKEDQRKAREETLRLEMQREAERKLKREAKEERRRREAWDYYEARWKKCMASEPFDSLLKFRDIPWPVFDIPTVTEHLTTGNISVFLLYGIHGDDGITESKLRKERIREALLRWHPDKFEGKMGSRLDPREREMVAEGVGIVVRCLNQLMAT